MGREGIILLKKLFRAGFSVAFLLAVLLLLKPQVLKADALTAQQTQQVNDAVAQIVATIPSWADTDAEKALYLHDYVVDHVAYEMVGEHQNAYGALIDGKAVCAGYADAYLKLLQAVGIEARTMTGTSKGERHAWTQVYLNGKCYYTDTTWDDPFVDDKQIKSHNYFNLSYKEMAKDHTFDSASLKYVDTSCNHSGIDYYDIMAGKGTGVAIFNDSTTASEAAKYFILKSLDGNIATYYCDYRFDGENIVQWTNDNQMDIISALGLRGTVGVSWTSSENTYQLSLKGTASNIQIVKVSSVELSPDKISLTAIGQKVALSVTIKPENAFNKAYSFRSSDKSVATVDEKGVVKAVGVGTATITVTTSDGNKTDTCVVTVTLAHVHDKTLKKVSGTPATCEKGGTIDYYICESCGEWFKNPDATGVITDHDDIHVPPLDHDDSGWKYDGESHWKICKRNDCGKLIPDSTAAHADSNGDGKCDVCKAKLSGNGSGSYDTKPTDPTGKDPEQSDPEGSQQPIDPADSENFADLIMDKIKLIGMIAGAVLVLAVILVIILKKR